jgi:hypothetical protein
MLRSSHLVYDDRAAGRALRNKLMQAVTVDRRRAVNSRLRRRRCRGPVPVLKSCHKLT